MRIALVGGGEHAGVVVDAARLQGLAIAGYADRQAGARVEQACGLTWLGTDLEIAAAHPELLFIITVGNVAARVAIAERLEAAGVRFATVIHPRAIVSPSATIEAGSAICAGAIVNPGARVGAHAIVNSGAIVEHDVHIGRLTHVAPGVAIGGGARIGERTFVGLGARIRDHISVGDDVVVGMGAAVVRDVANGTRVMGVPATPI